MEEELENAKVKLEKTIENHNINEEEIYRISSEIDNLIIKKFNKLNK